MIACKQFVSGSCRSFLIVCPKTRQAALVDPVLEQVDVLRGVLKEEGLRLSCVIDTHTHADHLSAGTALRDEAPYLMHAKSKVATVTRRVADGETIGVGGLKIAFLHTPGHTSDSMSLLLEDRLLSGDFLFAGADGAGRLDFPGSDVAEHFDSLRKLDALGDELLLFPAHEYCGKGGRTLGEERRSNPVLSPRSREAYLRWWEERRREPEEWMGRVVGANLAGAATAGAVAIPAGASACCAASDPAPGDLSQVSPEELSRRLWPSEARLTLLDVRTPEEFNDELGHIAGALLIPLDALPARLKEVPPGPVIVICRSGKRAAKAAAMLKDAGRAEVRVLTGGMLAWNAILRRL